MGEASDGERFQVLVHVDAQTIRTGTVGPGGMCELASGWAISPQTARRLACDSDVVRLLVDANGSTIDAGRKTRVIGKRLRRALQARDRCCRAPGCSRPVHAWHHIWHWIDGGPTDRANLAGLCLAHHLAVHAGDLTISTPGDETFYFQRRGGQAIPDVPAPAVIEGTLEATQTELGIDDTTILPNWSGEYADVHETTWLLYQHRDRAERAEAS